MHEEFYRFIANAYDKPRYYLHYKADAPINIRALFYVPEYKPSKIVFCHVGGFTNIFVSNYEEQSQ